jgi:hypothetical protein
MADLHAYKHPRTGKPAAMISDDTMTAIQENKDKLNSAIVYDRDFNFNYFGFKVPLAALCA